MTDATGKIQIPDSTVAGERRLAEHSKVRRRLILAAGAALPSIYTLSSGAQVAAASNMACWANQPATAPNRFTTAPDNWYRSEVYVGDHKLSPAYCVSDRQENCIGSGFDLNSDTKPGPTSVPRADKGREGSVWIVDGTRTQAGPTMQITNVRGSYKNYGLVYVNKDGTVATLDPTVGSNLNPVAGTCWTSILGGRISKLG